MSDLISIEDIQILITAHLVDCYVTLQVASGKVHSILLREWEWKRQWQLSL